MSISSLPPERPHIRFPFQRDPVSHRIQVVEQDTPEHVMSCEMVIVHCPIGYRDDRPEFGWPWPELSNMPIDFTALKTALENFEPRGEADITAYADIAAAIVRAHVDISITSSDGGYGGS